MEIIGSYKNGNYNVTIFGDGTKVRFNNLDYFEAKFPENIDIKITNQCNMNCPMCHEDSCSDGDHGDIMNLEFINTLHPYTELAIGGGNPLSHPDLEKFLEKLKFNKIIPNITVHMSHFMSSFDFIKDLCDRKLVYGVGVSLTSVPNDEFIKMVQSLPNAVIHVINGIFTEKMMAPLLDKNIKILILGYKDFRRGESFFRGNWGSVIGNKDFLHHVLPYIVHHFNTVSFDNLAIEQLHVKRLMSEDEWNRFYMGDDGNFTMYIDAVKKKFAKSSVSTDRYSLLDNIDDMFKVVRDGVTDNK